MYENLCISIIFVNHMAKNGNFKFFSYLVNIWNNKLCISRHILKLILFFKFSTRNKNSLFYLDWILLALLVVVLYHKTCFCLNYWLLTLRRKRKKKQKIYEVKWYIKIIGKMLYIFHTSFHTSSLHMALIAFPYLFKHLKISKFVRKTELH